MADTLYLSLWYPNLRLEALPDKLIAVLSAFAAHGGEAKVYSATVWPVTWNEAPTFERLYGRMAPGLQPAQTPGADPRVAVEEALELLHEDYAYEFQIGWSLWELEMQPAGNSGAQGESAGSSAPAAPAHTVHHDGSNPRVEDPNPQGGDAVARVNALPHALLDARWARVPRLVRVTGYGPLFDEAAYEQDGHIRIDFGSDAPFLEEDADLDLVGARHVEENVRQLVALTAAVEKASGATARLMWSELGESLAKRLAARLGMEN
ncbi:MAG TPA: hypothetical protein VMT38_08930 [Terracidiphilus sp.]|nr:hypothetical protein [Terracidiphilus sp.]